MLQNGSVLLPSPCCCCLDVNCSCPMNESALLHCPHWYDFLMCPMCRRHRPWPEGRYVLLAECLLFRACVPASYFLPNTADGPENSESVCFSDVSRPYRIRVPRYNTENVIRVPRYNTENVILHCAVQKSPRILGEIWVFWSNIGDLSNLVFQ